MACLGREGRWEPLAQGWGPSARLPPHLRAPRPQAYLHSMNIIHRDLNSHNCLVREVSSLGPAGGAAGAPPLRLVTLPEWDPGLPPALQFGLWRPHHAIYLQCGSSSEPPTSQVVGGSDRLMEKVKYEP